MAKDDPVVLLYSVTLHTWEAWQTGRPLARGSLDACLKAFPEAMEIAVSQVILADRDRAG
jgi:hypothetical protein